MTTPTPLPRVAAIAILFFCAVDSRSQDDGIPLAPPENRRPPNWRPSESVTDHEVLIKASEAVRKDAAREYQELLRTNAGGRWKATAESIDKHSVPEWFKDAKFGMFIDYGPWSIAGWAPKKRAGQMIPDWYEMRMYKEEAFRRYHEKNWGSDFERDDFLPLFTAKDYDPARLVELAEETGVKYVVPFCKHHAGFCMWPSAFTRRDAGDMGPHRDLIAPLAKLSQDRGLKFGFYLSVEEWEYPLLDADGQLMIRHWDVGRGPSTGPYTHDLDAKITGKIPVRDYATEYLVPQAKEFIDKYDPDLIWYDGEWCTPLEQLHTYDIAAYLYNKAEGRKEVAVNDRYGRGTRSELGDFYTSEYGHMGDKSKKSTHAWEECRGISQSYGYNWQDTEDNVITSKQLIDMFVDIVANGGNLLLMINLDGQGALPKVQENRLRDIGKWLNVNGEGIYATRPFRPSGGRVRLDLARWIWFPEGNPAVGAPVERRYFRRTFMLPEDRKVRKAVCEMSADDEFTLFVNGQSAGQGRGHASVRDIDAKPFLRPGQNLLAVSAANADTAPPESNPAGLIGVLHIEFEQGKPLTIVTDKSWLVSEEAPDGWQEMGLDDAGWAAAMDLGEYGMSPWGKLNTDTVAKRSTVFTQSKDGSVVYVILKQWPGQEFTTDVIEPLPNSQITMLGYDKPLKWTRQDSGTTVFLSQELQGVKGRPGEHAWVLKVERPVGERQNTAERDPR